MLKEKRVIVGISGGVDSATTAFILKEQGYEVIGVTLVQSEEQKGSQDLKDAKKVCELLEIEHIILDISSDFKKEVIEYFLEEYSNGMTPSPCVICDEKIKIKVLLKIADEKLAKYIATGHYCNIEKNEKFQKNLLRVSKDPRKDQSYMLYRLKPENLDRIIFPLYGLRKSEVRELAKKIGLTVHDKKDSQGICFAKNGYIEFLRENLKDKIRSGNYIDKNGNIMGEHEGYQLYTLGQRRGLGVIFSRAYFIVEIRPETNEIVLGEYEELKRKRVKLIDVSLHIPLENLENLEVIGRPRFSSEGAPGKILKIDEEIYFEYREENYHNAPGQHLVIYLDNFVLGGGKIVF